MKKCPRCRVVYKEDAQMKCLYCEGSLLTAKEADFIGESQNKGSAFDLSKAKELKFQDKITHDRKEYLIGTFFRGSTFLSSYRFNLHELKKGRAAKRFFIRPPDLGTLIKIPWLFVNVIYSMVYFFTPKSYCAKCGYQYIPAHGEAQHDPAECSYNQEYDMIEQEVFSGKVFIDLDPVRQISDAKVKKGQRSALRELLNRNMTWEKTLDVISIIVSIIIYVYLLVLIAMPLLNKIYHFDTIG